MATLHQEKSDFLINPRENNEEYTKFSFPSKLTEYLKTGKPVICYKLDGIPQEYDEVLFYIDDYTKEDLLNLINGFDQIKLKEYRKKLINFIHNHKSTEIQSNRILNFLNRI